MVALYLSEVQPSHQVSDRIVGQAAGAAGCCPWRVAAASVTARKAVVTYFIAGV